MPGIDRYRERMMAATREAQADERELQRRIAKLYEKSAEDMARKAAAAKADSLTEAQALALKQSLRSRSRELWGGIDRLTQDGMRKAAGRSVNVQTDFLLQIGQSAGLDLKPTLARVFGSTADDAVAHVLRGGIYGGNAPMLSRRIWNNEALQGGKIEEIIAQAVTKGESPIKLAKALEAYVNPKAAEPGNWNDIYDIPFDYKIDYNAKRLAVTSIRHAAWGAAVTAARDNPFADYFHWELTPAHVIFDICDAHAAHDEGLGEGNFPIAALPLPHPWCTCLYYVDTDKSLDEIGRELRAWMDGGDNTKLDRAFESWDGRDTPAQILHLRFAEPGSIQTIMPPDKEDEPSKDVVKRVMETIERIKADFPSLKKLTGIEFGNEEGVAAVKADGTGIRLDMNHFKTIESAKMVLNNAIAAGHTVNVDDPMFIVAHEVGHALHGYLALKRSGYSVYPIGGVPLASYKQHRTNIGIDMFTHSIFTNESTEEIYRMIKEEMGSRALDGVNEMIAQAVAMKYYGKGDHPIADSFTRYLKFELEGL